MSKPEDKLDANQEPQTDAPEGAVASEDDQPSPEDLAQKDMLDLLSEDDVPEAQKSDPDTEPAKSAPNGGSPEGGQPDGNDPDPEPKPTDKPGEEPAGDDVLSQSITIRGHKTTVGELLAEIQKDPSRIVDFATTYEQFPHLQGRYQELLERSRSTPAPAAIEPNAGTAGAPDPVRDTVRQMLYPNATPQQLDQVMSKSYSPMVRQMFGITDEEAEFAPGLARGLAYMMAAVETVGVHVGNLIQANEVGKQKAIVTESVSGIENAMSEVANSGEFFAPLKEQNEQTRLLEYLAERYDPRIDAIDGQMLREAWVAMNSEDLIKSMVSGARQNAQADAARRGQARQTAAAGAAGAPTKKEISEFEELVNED